MELRTRKMWTAALLAAAVMALAPSPALARGMDPGELKARMESFANEAPETTVLEPGEFKAIAEAPARFAVLDPGELKALMESGSRPVSGEVATGSSSGSVQWTGVGITTLVLLFAVGSAVVYGRRRHDHIAPA